MRVVLEAEQHRRLEIGRERVGDPEPAVRRHQHPEVRHDVRGEQQVHRGQPERRADQGFERAVRRRPPPVDLVDQIVAEQHRLGRRVELGEHLHQLVEQGVEGGDRGNVLLEQPVQDPGGPIEADRRVDQQHPLEAEGSPLVVQPGDERRLRRAQAVADEIVAGDRDLVLEIARGSAPSPGRRPGRPRGAARAGARSRPLTMKFGCSGEGSETTWNPAWYRARCRIRLLLESKLGAGAGKDEHQPRRARLRRERVAERGVVPEDVRHLASPKRQSSLSWSRDRLGQVGLVIVRRADHGRFVADRRRDSRSC